MSDRPLKVLIVDDESNTRGLVKVSLDWESLNMEVVGDATSGLEAIDMMESLLPDIIITDIQMPYMDGLTLSKIIKEKHPDISIVILTAHNEFSYAQRAVSIGVSDFILKPIDKNLLLETMTKVGNSIKSNRDRLSKLELSHQYIKSNITVFQNKVFNDLISNSLNFTFQPEELKMVDINIDTDYDIYQVSLINITVDKSRYTNLERQVLLQKCCSYIKELYLLSGRAYVFTDIYSNIVLLNNDDAIYLNDISERATIYLKEQLSTVISCGIGMEVHSIENIYISYQQALNALNMCYITGEEITFADSQITEAEHSVFQQNTMTDKMKLAIKSGSTIQAVHITKMVLQNYAKENINDLDGVKIFVLNISTYIKELLSEMKIPSSGNLFLSGEMLLEVFKLEKYSEIENTVITMVEKVCILITEALSRKNNSTVANTKNYLDENFSDSNLTLKTVADKFYINSSYLSRIFKKGTGISFSEYLTKIRIENATVKLKTEDFKAYQLAQMVGIPDPNYFVKCFKKITGISFAEYKLKKS
jgi:two-component system, response regulator YesN